MARSSASSSNSTAHGNYRHDQAKRRNAPTAETEAVMTDDDRQPKSFSVDRRKIDTPVLVWQREGRTSVVPDEEGGDPIEFEARPLYIREKIDPMTLVDQLRRHDEARQGELFGDFNGLPPDADTFRFYEYDGHWQNRLIHGNSTMVMESLINKDGLAGKVQMIYYDPPYGMSYRSNFQPTTNSQNVTDGEESIPVGDALPIRAFKDTYRNGIDSYLDSVHETAVLARELLADTGSLFLQIGDDNVHRCAVLLDEVFGASNRVATITWRPTAGSSARLLPESASYLLWYAKDVGQTKFQHIYQERDMQATMDDFGMACIVELPDGTMRRPNSEERNDVRTLPDGSLLFGVENLQSQGYSPTGRSVDYWFDGRWHSTGETRQWRVSVHAPRQINGVLVEPADDEVCPGDPDDKQAICGMCSLKKQGRLHATDKGPLRWKWYQDERPGTRYDNVWHQTARPLNKRYVVQTAASIIERCLLMTTDPGDLVFDPTCGSGATAEAAEAWGRRWITCDVQRVAVAVARKHLMTRTYPWHLTLDGSDNPFAGFKEETMPRVSAATLAYGTFNDPENQIRLVDRTKVDKSRHRVCSPFTVESSSPYAWVPADDADEIPASDWSTVDDKPEAMLDALRKTPICDSDGRPLFRVGDAGPLPHNLLVAHQAECFSERGADRSFTAGVLIASPDATITNEIARRAVVEMKESLDDSNALLLIGYEFDPRLRTELSGIELHRVQADKAIQIAHTRKGGNDGGTFTLLSSLECELEFTRDDNGEICTVEVGSEEGKPSERPLVTVELLGWDVYDPATGQVRSGDPDTIDCWMIDINHNGFSFYSHHIYFPDGANGTGLAKLAKSLGDQLAPDAEEALWSLKSRPFPAPDPGRNIAVKAITTTGAEITATINEGW